MCPACFSNLAIAMLGLTSTSGLTALVWRQSLSSPDETSGGITLDETLTPEQSEDHKEH